MRSQRARDINGTTFSKTSVEQGAIECFLVNSTDGAFGSGDGADYLEPVVLHCCRKVRSSEIVVLDDKDLPNVQVCPLTPRTVGLRRMAGKA